MKKKLVSCMMSLSLISSVIGSATISASGSSSQSQQVDSASSSTKSEVLSNITTMSEYIKAGEDGFLHLSGDSKNAISDEIYEVFKRGVDSTNQLIEQGALKLDDEGNVVAVNYTPPTGNEISPLAFGNFYSWGYALTLTDRESKDLAYAMTASGTAGAAFTAIMGLIPSPPTKLAQAISYIINAGFALLANDISYKNAGKGVTINIHYALYYTISTNS